MGTRGAFGVRIDGVDKVTYNHFDSYPAGLGDDVVKQLGDMLASRGHKEVERFARELRLIDGNTRPTAEDREKYKHLMDPGVGDDEDRDGKSWYSLLRHAQGCLDVLLDAGVMIDGHKFLNDSLFCEYAYILNFDEDTFEVYRGFQKSKPSGRYADLPPDRGYYAVSLVAEFPLRAVPADWKRIADPPEDEDDEAPEPTT